MSAKEDEYTRLDLVQPLEFVHGSYPIFGPSHMTDLQHSNQQHGETLDFLDFHGDIFPQEKILENVLPYITAL